METLVCQDMVQVVKKKTDPGDLKVKPIDLHLISSAASRVCRQGAHPCSVWSNSGGWHKGSSQPGTPDSASISLFYSGIGELSLKDVQLGSGAGPVELCRRVWQWAKGGVPERGHGRPHIRGEPEEREGSQQQRAPTIPGNDMILSLVVRALYDWMRCSLSRILAL